MNGDKSEDESHIWIALGGFCSKPYPGNLIVLFFGVSLFLCARFSHVGANGKRWTEKDMGGGKCKNPFFLKEELVGDENLSFQDNSGSSAPRGLISWPMEKGGSQFHGFRKLKECLGKTKPKSHSPFLGVSDQFMGTPNLFLCSFYLFFLYLFPQNSAINPILSIKSFLCC